MKKLICLITILAATSCQNFANVEGYTFTDDSNTELGTSSDDNTVIGGTSSDSNTATDNSTETGGDTQTGVGDTQDTNTGFDTIDDSGSSTATTDSDVDSDTNSSSDSGIADSDSNSETDSSNCVLKERRCDEVANQTQVCDAQGIWQNEQKCQYVCHNGFCTGECYPDQIRCDESTGVPQLCNTLGQWENQSACPQNALCAAGECVCSGGLTNCDNTCINLKNNPDNCGACGHNCLGGDCVDEECQSFVMADNIDRNSFLAISDTHIYEFNKFNAREFYVNRIQKSGGTMTPFFSQEANATATTVSADGSIVWDAYSTLDKSGTIYTYPDSKGIFADQLEKPVKQFIINNGIVYWDQIFSDHTEIFARPADFSKNTERVVYSDYVIDRFAVIGDCLFLGGTYDLIRHCSLTDPGAVVYRAPEELHLLNNFSNDDYVYFRSINEGILRVSAESSAQPELVTSYIDRDVIVADDGTLYYIDGDSGGAPACTTNWGLYKTEPSSPEVRIPLILPPMACPGSLIVDADALYWVNYDDSTLMKLAR